MAADLIRQLAVPPEAEVVVLGDTAFEAADIRVACGERGWSWIVPLNPERVLAGPKPRPKVLSLVSQLSAERFEAIRLVPGTGRYAAQRRAARCRVGPKAKARVYYAQAERRQVHHVGDVLLVFSTTEKPKAGEPVPVQKVLMSNDGTRTAAQVVQLYDLRWQIELFFKECKGTLGLHRYRFREFVKVENWVQACLVSFVYLEWYRAWQLGRRDQDEGCKAWWRWQRCYGVSVAMGQATEEHDLRRVYRLLETPTGQRKLRKCLAAACPSNIAQPAKKTQATHKNVRQSGNFKERKRGVCCPSLTLRAPMRNIRAGVIRPSLRGMKDEREDHFHACILVAANVRCLLLDLGVQKRANRINGVRYNYYPHRQAVARCRGRDPPCRRRGRRRREVVLAAP